MTILLFLVDCSASMAQSSYQGLSFLEHARGFVTNIRKAREQMKAQDRYMLVTTEEYPQCIKAGFRETSQVFETSVNNLRAHGHYHMGSAVLNALKYINTHRAAAGCDQFGMGRWFSLLNDSVVIIVITDSYGATSFSPKFQLMYNQKHCAGEFVDEAFRWDQRVFSIILRLPSQYRPQVEAMSRLDTECDTAISRLCRQTGGRTWGIYSHEQSPHVIQQFISCMSLSGAILKFDVMNLSRNGLTDEKERERQALSARLEKRALSMIYIKHSGAITTIHWPIPESYPMKAVMEGSTLPPRSGHPSIYIMPGLTDVCHTFVEMPFDRYEVEPGPLTEYVIDSTRDKAPNLGYTVHVRTGDTYGKPFGYLKAVVPNSGLVSLFVLPYNYPQLLPLLEELKQNPSVKVLADWREKLLRYIRGVPPYYLSFLRKQFRRLNVPGDLFENSCNMPPFNDSIAQQIKIYRDNAKREYEHVITQVTNQYISSLNVPHASVIITPVKHLSSTLPCVEMGPSCSWQLQLDQKTRDDLARKRICNLDIDLPMEELTAESYDAFQLTICDKIRSRVKESIFVNPLNLRRKDLINSLPLLYENFRQSISDQQSHFLQGGRPGTLIRLQHTAELHNQPVYQMGVYEEYIKSLTLAGLRPREIDGSSTSAGFGNPFTKRNMGNFGVDEVLEGPNTGSSQQNGNVTKKDKMQKIPRHRTRKSGPLSWNALRMWRNQRKTISDRSSVVSDISYTSDLTESDQIDSLSDVMPSKSSGSELNGHGETLALDSRPLKRHNGEQPANGETLHTKKRKVQDAEQSHPDSAKWRKGRLSEDALRLTLQRTSEIVRSVRNDHPRALKDLLHELMRQSTSLIDQHRIIVQAIREAERFKMSTTRSFLDIELQRIVKQLHPLMGLRIA